MDEQKSNNKKSDVAEFKTKNEEKKFNNFNKKILDNYIIEMNKSENNEK